MNELELRKIEVDYVLGLD